MSAKPSQIEYIKNTPYSGGTVADLIAALQKHDPSLQVIFTVEQRRHAFCEIFELRRATLFGTNASEFRTVQIELTGAEELKP